VGRETPVAAGRHRTDFNLKFSVNYFYTQKLSPERGLFI